MPNTIPVSFNLNGLFKKLNYNFTIEGLGGNWPVTAIPSSGEFTSIAKTGQINTIISFCETTGSCIDDIDILQYDPSKVCTFDPYNIFTFVRAKAVLSDDTSIIVYSDPVYINCNDCLPIAAIPSNISLDNTTNNFANFTAIVSGIEPGKNYSYSFKALESDWPVLLQNKTGIFSSPTDIYCIDSYIEFCSNTGICLSGTKNVLDFSLSDSCLLNKKSLKAKIITEISSLSCSGDIIKSNIMNFKCDDCFPQTETITVNPNNKIVPKDSLENITFNVSNLKPNTLYTYNINSIYSEWPIYVTKPSGFIYNSLTYQDIQTQIAFCSSTGVCQSGYKGVLDYTLSNENIVNKYIDTNLPYGIIQMTIQEDGCDDKIYYSNRLLLECSDCNNGLNVSVISVNIQ